MRVCSAKRVRDVLRTQLHLEPAGRGDGSGHEPWRSSDGRCVRPALRHKEIPYAYLYSLGLELETKGFIARRAFLDLFRQ